MLLPGTQPNETSYLRNHYRGASEHLENSSKELRQCSPEQVLFENYEREGSPHGKAIYAVKGEHWNGVAPKFLDFINQYQLKPSDMGYAECGYGIEKHRKFIKELVVNEHGLETSKINSEHSLDFGCLAMTTRMAMYDFAKVAYRETKAQYPHSTPVALVPTPSWDYKGIFKDVGFEIVYLPIRPANNWQPDLKEWANIALEVISKPTHKIAMCITNPQHNPTGMQWSLDVTEFLMQICVENNSYLLLDDAYFNVHDARIPVKNGLKRMVELFRKNGGDNSLIKSGFFDRWLMTRPFGKQFSCNTMGVAAITTSPKMLRKLNRESWINRYHCNTHNAEIMCNWLQTQDSIDWTIETGQDYWRKKKLVQSYLKDEMNWPTESICVGPSTSYMLFQVPKVYQQNGQTIDSFRDDLFNATGTLICASLYNQGDSASYVRLHVGSDFSVIGEILRRWKAAGLSYTQENLFNPKESLNNPIDKVVLRSDATTTESSIFFN